jgi:hypothetical protein
MKKFIITLCFIISTLISLACHESYVTLVSGPTAIGGGQYTTTVQVCIGQTVNWGGTNDFTMTISGATFSSYSPASLSNTYNAYLGASCNGPNCFMNSCGSVSATATSTSTATVVTYTTTSSTPAGAPLVPDDVWQCGGNPTSYCFNFTFVTNGCPTSVSLGGNTERMRPTVCVVVCGHSATYAGGPCNGTYDPAMTLALGCVLPIELELFEGTKKENHNHIGWVTSTETNNEYFTLEKSNDAKRWYTIHTEPGAGNSNTPNMYEYKDYETIIGGVSYYRLTQTDFNGNNESFQIISIINDPYPQEIPKAYDVLGKAIDDPDNYIGIIIYKYSNGFWYKIARLR